jgi:di/tricarboxylate transporter
MEIAFVLLLLLAAIVLFARETLPVDVVTLLVLLALLFTRILTPQEAFSGFGSDIIIILASVFVISGALRESGVVDWLGESLAKMVKGGERSLLTLLMGSVAGVSAFMNNTTVTAVMIAPVTGIARQRKLSPSRFLMPLAFASILGGTCTLIGTSTNVAVRGYLERTGLPPLGFFELTPVGIVIVIVGIFYMLFIGRRMLPTNTETTDLTTEYNLSEYLSEIVIKEGSPLVGQTLTASDLSQHGFRVLKILRDGAPISPRPSASLHAGDVLLVSGPVASLLKVRETEGIDIKPDVKFADRDLKSDDLEILEVLVTPQSGLRGRRIDSLDMPRRLGIAVLAINRHGQRLREKLKTTILKTGDLLLVQGSRESMDTLRASPDFAIFSEQTTVSHRSRKGILVLVFLLVGVGLSAAEIVPLSAGLLGAAVAAVLTRCLPMHKVYACIEWRLLVLIAGMTAFGVAMEKTGAAAWLAGWIVAGLEPFGGVVVMTGFVLLTIILTQPMSNAAAALVVLPIALSTADQLGLNARSFAVAITYAASISLIAPFEPSSLLVYGPGKYRFVDFMKVGGLLTLILVAIVIALVPIFWPLAKP